MNQPQEPQWPDIGVITLATDSWGSRWMVRHHIMAGLGRYFRVVWVNPAHSWREIPQAWKSRSRSVASVLPGFSVYTPEPWLPALYNPVWLAQLLFQRRMRRARHLLESQGAKRIVLYLWNPQFESALTSFPHDLACYHLEDEYSYSPVELPVDPVESRLLSAADQVFMLSPALMEKKGMVNPSTSFVPAGVDYAAYSKTVPEPDDLSGIPRPRIGYSGYLKQQLDWSLLQKLVRGHPEWSFVFLGSEKQHEGISEATQMLSSHHNVFFLGAKASAEMPPYAQHFDVCIMPYRKDGYTKFIYPLKLHEYLAAGRPTVGTSIRSLQDFANVISLADTYEEWSTAIAEGLKLSANTVERCEIRRAVALEYDWASVTRKIAFTIAGRLDRKNAGVPIQERLLS